jgi:5-methylcytosine-specific restriction endonuclease McrA
MASNRPGYYKRNCNECGKTFLGDQLICHICRGKPKSCIECGKIFRGTAFRCKQCRATREICFVCGELKLCPDRHICHACQNKARKAELKCESCDHIFKGRNEHICSTCRQIERICPNCASAFKGIRTICQKCYLKTLPIEKRQAYSRSGNNARRARIKLVTISEPISSDTYMKIRNLGSCVYCDKPACVVDHITPLARGGHEAEYNLVPACKSCNSSKQARMLIDWDSVRVTHACEVSPAVRREYARQLAGVYG